MKLLLLELNFSNYLLINYNEQTNINADHMLGRVDFSQERHIKINSKFEELRKIMEREGRTIIQGQLGYLMAINKTIIPIPGAKTVQKIEENAGALEFGPISQDAVK